MTSHPHYHDTRISCQWNHHVIWLSERQDLFGADGQGLAEFEAKMQAGNLRLVSLRAYGGVLKWVCSKSYPDASIWHHSWILMHTYWRWIKTMNQFSWSTSWGEPGLLSMVTGHDLQQGRLESHKDICSAINLAIIGRLIGGRIKATFKLKWTLRGWSSKEPVL